MSWSSYASFLAAAEPGQALAGFRQGFLSRRWLDGLTGVAPLGFGARLATERT
ncbi:hypothetical protein [Micromonospora sp. MA102]|uniref:hypothetical protein n=1 Tax=Micromonospora sp. MA102 TaxID=2952755 RepID=UPI0021C671B5|nr:hypothetical protein [Micromonospora sp. MA102]